MKRISRNIMIILRTERMIARREMAVALNRAAVYAFAGLVALIALLMLNVAAYRALAVWVSPQAAAALVALANALLSGILVAIARRIRPGPELGPVTELRDLAQAELEADLEGMAEEARDTARNLRRVARDPLGSALPSLIGPLLSILLKAGRKQGRD